MSSLSQIMSRLEQQKNQTARMLSPGAKMLPGDLGSWDFSPIAPDFGGRKFQLAAQKMRILDEKRLGSFHSETIKNLAGSIQAKFQDVQQLLHISADPARKTNAWTEVEKVFPNQVSKRSETPLEPGEMRQGSVIQQFSTFPKPGQSLEAFKQQAQRIPRPNKPEASAPQKARLDPKDRLFSRVQEISSTQKKNISVEQSSSDKGGESAPPVVQRQVEKPDSSANVQAKLDLASLANVEPQSDQVIEPTQASLSKVPEQARADLPVETKPVQSTVPFIDPAALALARQASENVNEQLASAAPASSPVEKNSEPLALGEGKVGDGPLPVSQPVVPAPTPVFPLAKAKTAETGMLARSELTLAQPALRKKSGDAKLLVALPVKKPGNLTAKTGFAPAARPNAAAVLSRTDPNPTHSAPRPGTQVIQRQPEQAGEQSTSAQERHITAQIAAHFELPDSVYTPVQTGQTSAVQPEEGKLVPAGQVSLIEPNQPQSPAMSIGGGLAEESTPVNDLPEMPLQKRLERLQFASAHPRVGADAPLPFTGRNVPRLSINSAAPILVANKYSQGGMPGEPVFNRGSQPALVAAANSFFFPQPGMSAAPAFENPAAPVSSVPQKNIPSAMTLAKASIFRGPPVSVNAAESPSTPLPPALANADRSVESNSQAVQSVSPGARQMPRAAARNVVQRIWEEHSPVQHSQTGQGNGQNVQDQMTSADIHQLAEKIMPLVKRLLEIESDRFGSRFRK